jgi:DNA-binding NarL/FixJ family response regulator
MSIATAWLELAAQERAAHNKRWGKIPQKKGEEKYIPKKRKGTRDPKRLELIREMIREGLRTVDIAEELGVSESSIRYWRKHYNLT